MKPFFVFISKLCIGYILTIQLTHGQAPDIAKAQVPPLNNLEREIAHFESKVDSNSPSPGSGQFSAHSHGPHTEHTEHSHHGPTNQPNSHVPNSVPGLGGSDKVTDVHGNVPPHLGGLHVDLPGEHGNTKEFAVLHEGHLPLTPSGHDASNPPVPSSGFGPPDLSDITGSSGGLSISDGIHTSSDHNHAMPFGSEDAVKQSVHLGPPDLFDIGKHSKNDHAHNSQTHVDLPGEHGNNSPMPVVHRPIIPVPGHGPGHSGSHVDLPGVHGNNSPMPVVHRPIIPVPGHGPGHSGSHVDLPGVHGNNSPMPVVHRPIVPVPGHGPGHSGSHVDLPGVHGNNSPMPVVHRPIVPVQGHGPGHSGSHVDLPGVHGNNSPMPVVHRPIVPVHGHTSGHSGSHVEPGVHGNNSPMPVVHRPIVPIPGHGDSGSHVDLHRVHGNNSPMPVVNTPFVPIQGHGDSGTHVDLPGVHGNNSPMPVVHRSGSPMPGHGHSGSHVDFTGENGNDSPLPVVHRPIVPVHGPGLKGSNVDLLGVHGHGSPIPLVHRPGGSNPGHVSGHSGSHIDLSGVNDGSLIPVAHRPSISSHGSPPDLFEILRSTSPLSDTHISLHTNSGLEHSKMHSNMPGVDGNLNPLQSMHRNELHDTTLLSPGLASGNTGSVSMLPDLHLHSPIGVLPGARIPTFNQIRPSLRGTHLIDRNRFIYPNLPLPLSPVSSLENIHIRDAQGLLGRRPMVPIVPTGLPKDSFNVPVVPNSRREERRAERRRLRKLQRRRLRNQNRSRGGLLDDIIKTSKAVRKDRPHKHNDKTKQDNPKSRQGKIMQHSPIRRGGILGALLGSMHRRAPGVIHIGGPPPGPPRDPLQAMAGRLVGMLVNRLVSG